MSAKKESKRKSSRPSRHLARWLDTPYKTSNRRIALYIVDVGILWAATCIGLLWMTGSLPSEGFFASTTFGWFLTLWPVFALVTLESRSFRTFLLVAGAALWWLFLKMLGVEFTRTSVRWNLWAPWAFVSVVLVTFSVASRHYGYAFLFGIVSILVAYAILRYKRGRR